MQLYWITFVIHSAELFYDLISLLDVKTNRGNRSAECARAQSDVFKSPFLWLKKHGWKHVKTAGHQFPFDKLID